MNSLPSQDGVLLGSDVQINLTRSSPDLHLEDVSILKVADAAGTSGEFGHGFITVEECSARQFGAHAVGVEKDDVPAIAVIERHENAPLHGEIVSEGKANLSTITQAIENKQANEIVSAIFDPDRLQMEMQRNLPEALRKLAAAIESGQMQCNLAGFVPWGFKTDCRDDRCHLLVKLHVAAEIRRPMEVHQK